MSSGVANHFFYLLAEGTEEGAGGPSKVCSDCRQTATEISTLKTLKKIGRAKAGEIWYTALTQYFVSHTNYTLARDATLLAALDLSDVYGDCEAFNATNSAWDAVNLHYPIHQFSCPR
jgi:Zn-dependent metalloprotease